MGRVAAEYNGLWSTWLHILVWLWYHVDMGDAELVRELELRVARLEQEQREIREWLRRGLLQIVRGCEKQENRVSSVEIDT